MLWGGTPIHSYCCPFLAFLKECADGLSSGKA